MVYKVLGTGTTRGAHPRHVLRVASQQDVGAAPRHVGGDGDGAAPPALRHDLRFALHVLRLGVQQLIGDACRAATQLVFDMEHGMHDIQYPHHLRMIRFGQVMRCLQRGKPPLSFTWGTCKLSASFMNSRSTFSGLPRSSSYGMPAAHLAPVCQGGACACASELSAVMCSPCFTSSGSAPAANGNPRSNLPAGICFAAQHPAHSSQGFQAHKAAVMTLMSTLGVKQLGQRLRALHARGTHQRRAARLVHAPDLRHHRAPLACHQARPGRQAPMPVRVPLAPHGSLVHALDLYIDIYIERDK